MIIEEDKPTITTNMKFEKSVLMGVSAAAIPMIIERLVETYKNPYRSALREYTSNARDAQVLAGNPAPILVSLPHKLSPVLCIEDNGSGLSATDLEGFGQFGESSKRDDEEAIGGFGMGSKSGLAVSSQFTVTSVKDGKRNTVIVGRTTDNMPVMNFLEEKETDEPNGTKIILPIADRDLLDELTYFFMGWDKSWVLIDGKAPELSVYDTDQFMPLGGLGWRAKDELKSPTNTLFAVIGPVLYHIDINEADIPHRQYMLLRNTVLNIDNGSVKIAPSRETLIYNARTKKVIQERVDAILSITRTEFIAEIENATSVREAFRLRDLLKKRGFPVSGITYKGEPLVVPGEVADGKGPVDVVGLSISPEADTRTASGFRARRTETYLSKMVPWEIYNYLVPRFILVHSATFGGKNQYREDAYVADWFSALPSHDAQGTRFNTSIFMTDKPLTDLPKHYREMADIIIDAGKLHTEALAIRKSLGLNGSTRKKSDPLPTTVKVLRTIATSTRAADTKSVEADTLSEFTWTLTLRNEESQDRARAFLHTLWTTKKGYKDNSHTAYRLSSIIKERKVVVVLLGKNEKIDHLKGVLPPEVDIEDLIYKYVDATFPTFTPLQLRGLKDQTKGNMYTLTHMDESQIALVQRVETREWLHALKTKKSDNEQLRRDLGGVRFLSTRLSDLLRDGRPTASVTLPESPLSRYPLLAHVSGVKSYQIKDYINLVDLSLQP